MALAQQLIGLVKSHAEGDEERFFDLVIQLAADEDTGTSIIVRPLQNAGHGTVP